MAMTMSKSRNRRTAAVSAIVCLTTALGLPATAQAAGLDGAMHIRRAGRRRHVLPEVRQRRLRRATTTWTSPTTRRRRCSTGGDDQGHGDAERVPVQPRLRRARRFAASRSTAPRRKWTPHRARADGDAKAPRSSAADVRGHRPVRRRAGRVRASPVSTCGPGSWPRRMAPRSPASRRSRRDGSRSTTIRSTRPRTRSTSRCRTAMRSSRTGSYGTSTRAAAGRPGGGSRREPMASYLATIDIGFWDVHTLAHR